MSTCKVIQGSALDVLGRSAWGGEPAAGSQFRPASAWLSGSLRRDLCVWTFGFGTAVLVIALLLWPEFMWISFNRLAVCHQQEQFPTVVSCLSPSEGHLLLRSCITLLVDRQDLFFSAPALRLRYAESFSVPTPAVQVYVILGQAGEGLTVWNQELSDLQGASSHSSSDASSNP